MPTVHTHSASVACLRCGQPCTHTEHSCSTAWGCPSVPHLARLVAAARAVDQSVRQRDWAEGQWGAGSGAGWCAAGASCMRAVCVFWACQGNHALPSHAGHAAPRFPPSCAAASHATGPAAAGRSAASRHARQHRASAASLMLSRCTARHRQAACRQREAAEGRSCGGGGSRGQAAGRAGGRRVTAGRSTRASRLGDAETARRCCGGALARSGRGGAAQRFFPTLRPPAQHAESASEAPCARQTTQGRGGMRAKGSCGPRAAAATHFFGTAPHRILASPSTSPALQQGDPSIQPCKNSVKKKRLP